ncbi:potassium-transporting ATPase subunit F, partial [Bacillus sp. JCM 19041]|uniref:potassium-transporting ATPase subunit F n=1 Tax=Bacillus sp. JCM 19041 TaxID=1460637 RepID=UPI0006D22417
VGVFAIAVALSGYLSVSLLWPERVIFLVCSLLLIKPGITTDLIGVACLIATFIWHIARAKRQGRMNGIAPPY